MKMFDIRISNPWYTDNFANLYCTEIKVSTNKFFNFEVIRYARDLLRINLEYEYHCDHGGVTLELALLGYALLFAIRDTRHWDEDNNCWGSIASYTGEED